jgi:O-antigen biosynthesis protein
MARALLDSIRRARQRGVTPAEMLRKAIVTIRTDPRAFAGKLRRSGLAQEEYLRWVRNVECARSGLLVDARGLMSVVMPVCNTPKAFLKEVYESVCAQTYPDWELCIHDDASDAPWVRPLLEQWSRESSRVRVSYGSQRAGIAAATNAALRLASGRWLAFLDHDDLLHPDALAECAVAFDSSGAQLVYTDHDMLDVSGQRSSPFFKPDWNPDLLLSHMYMGHLLTIERTLVERLGGLRTEMDGAQDYDLVLRCVAAGGRVAHVPKVLYHWRQHSGSTAVNSGAKPYAHTAGQKAIQDFVDHAYPGARVDNGTHTFCYDVRYALREPMPLASIIIPTRDRVELLDVCVRSLLDKTEYGHYEIIVVDNGSVEPATCDWFAKAQQDARIRIHRADIQFNWSALNNLAAAHAFGDVLVFLNNDTEIMDGGWLTRLVENACRHDVGTCGPLLLYGDHTIQHAGVVVGMGGWADHVFKGLAPVHAQHLFVSPMMRRDVLAVTGACVAIAADKFRQLGGFDESFIVCGSDVEIGLRAHAAGLRNVYVPEACLIHHESKSRDSRAIPAGDFERSAEAYGRFRTGGDPFYSPNLDPMSAIPALRSAP